jgi:hypothetical protein
MSREYVVGTTYVSSGEDRDFMAVPAYVSTPPAGASAGRLKAWSGSTWALKPAKYWNGSSWVTKPVKTWNGSAWT